MSPVELFDEVRLKEAVAAQTAIVADQPSNIAERLLLCDLLAFTGDRDAVRKQLKRIENSRADLQSYIAEWHDLLKADDARHAGARPAFLAEPSEHFRRRLAAFENLHAGHEDEIIELLDSADELAPWVEGFVDGRPFEGWRDSDDLIGPIIEAFHGGRYFWIPFEQIRVLRLEESAALRDSLYRPATLLLTDASEWELFVPALYVGTAQHPEEGIRTGAGIDWMEQNGLMRGLGSRTFLFGEEELTISEFRQVEVRPL